MLFNSLDFAIFLPIVFILYWFVFEKNLKYQNALIVVASYIFYSWWDWRFLSLIIFSTFVDFYVGKKLKKEIQQSKRILVLCVSIIVNLGFLGFFKYYNFFLENFVDAFSLFGMNISANSLNIILPVGISFYTFQTLSYTIDVYKKKLEPTEDFIAFSAFVSFFPQLVAGPIERATNLLPQINKFRVFALTNWSGETFPKALKKFDFLGLFEGIVVSGDEKTRKPFEKIYRIALDRFKIEPTESIFIDDNLRNIKAAENLKIKGIHYKNPGEFEIELKNLNII